jgi:hypothetical protein
VSRPTDEDAAYLEEYLAKKQKKGKHEEEVPIEEKSQLHIKDEKVSVLVGEGGGKLIFKYYSLKAVLWSWIRDVYP